MNYWNEPVEFLARTPQSVELLAPVYVALDEFIRGGFYVPEKLLEQARELGVNAIGLKATVNQPLEVVPPIHSAPIVTAGYRDLLISVRTRAKRPHIHVQADEFKAGASEKINLFLCPNETMQAWVMRNWSTKQAEVCETPIRMAEAINKHVLERCQMKYVDQVDGESIGIIYMSFGEKAARAIQASYKSLRRAGLQIPACAIGSTPVAGLQFIEWTGESPFDPKERKNFQFRAGRVKPRLYPLSPFERTLYIDADTEFIEDILPGFELLSEYDVAVTRENLTLKELYNKKLAGWEINLLERDATIKELNAGDKVYFWNSGVLFFRKSEATARAMQGWHNAWMEWQQWDEQLALMRAFHRTPEAKLTILEPEWNYPHRSKEDIIIFHNYGRGVVRMNVEASEKVMA